jgi:hypothetical protein
MSESVPFDENEKIKAMKDSIADRAFNLKIKGMLISGALMAVGIGLMIFAPGLLGAATPLVGLLAAAGSAIAGLVTMKEAKKLEMDEQYLNSYMQGKNHWGSGYREEILERGYGSTIVTNGPEMGSIPGGHGGMQRGHG